MKWKKFCRFEYRQCRGLYILLVSFLLAVLLTQVVSFRYFDALLGDMICQSDDGANEHLYVIGIDAYALDAIGAWPWSRSVMADILNTLNEDPDNRPAAIGIDVVYSGETDPEADAALAEAASAGNVVLAGMVEYGTRIAGEGDSLFMDQFSVVETALPFPALSQAAETGHINAMYDSDGVLRRHLWEVELPDGTFLPSMPQKIYELYCQAHGLEGNFRPQTDSRGFWRIDYSAKPGDYYAYSVQDILSGAYDPEQLAGQIVLIGPYDTGLSDDFITAVDHAERMYGVEYIANVTGALLEERNPLELPDFLQYLLLAACCALCGPALYLCKQLHLAATLYLILAAGAVAGARILYQAGLVIHPLWIPTALTLLFLGCVAEKYYMASRERRFIVNTFERYVDPAILRELLKEGSESLGLGGKTRNIAVLFVDIRGFTPLSEKLEPEQVVEILNQYLTLTSDCIRSNRGTLDKFVGDCTMAVWGAPLECEDPVWQACKAAMDMVERGAPLEEKLSSQYGANVGFGIGIHYGPAVVGNIGAQDRMDYTAIGDTVNTAARLESNAPPGKIYISRKVADALGDCAKTTSLGTSVKLKGKAEGFEVLELEDLRPRRGRNG